MFRINVGSITARCIGIYDGKIYEEDQDLKKTDYDVKDVILLEDFNNGELHGYPKENPIVLNYGDKVGNVIIKGHYEYFNNDTKKWEIEENITNEEKELLDSLEEGDVIVFDYYAPITHEIGDSTNTYEIEDYFYSEIKNIEKYDDKYAADEIQLIINDAPIKYDY